ncbi:hypothetical protein GHT06_018783 [Daphnia sinensis]|uniref:Ski2 N-terminal domain-containing protein n=1 Tax=Daphnia sinensis TaxID=1820382 RepID=A0AAD5KNP5_9CRUS|nr:hypothetical protein GHT06_018783 [Daphnia sinensis]
MSLQRIPGPPSEWVRGSASNVPFWPGGLEWNPSETMSDFLQIDELLGGIVLQKRYFIIKCPYWLKLQLSSNLTAHLLLTWLICSKRIKGSIFKWIKEEPLLSKKNNFGDLNPFIFLP